MERNTKRVLLIILCLMAVLNRSNSQELIGNLYYQFYGEEATVCNEVGGDESRIAGSMYQEDSYIIPETVTYRGLNYTVTRIGRCAFGAYYTNYPASPATKIVLPSTLKKIGIQAFYYCKNLTSMIIPASVEEMQTEPGGVSVFGGCNLLRTLIYLGRYAPKGWTATTNTYVPDKTTYNAPYYSINNAKIIEMISFKDSQFEYSGHAPVTTYTNNVEGYVASLTIPVLESEVGSYEVEIPVTFTKDGESFVVHIPYKYTIKPAKLKAKVNNVSRTYGEQNPEFTISYSGFVNGEDESVLTTKPSVTTTATEKSAVGTYPITIGGGTSKNYTLEYEQGELIVNKASLSIQVMDANKVYGNENPTFTLSYSGLKNNETVPEWINAPQFITDAKKNSDAGIYPITVTCEPKNYTVSTNNPGILTIEQASLTIKANNATMDYCGTIPDYTYSYTGFLNGDNEGVLTSKPSIETDVTQTSNVGTYVITPKGAVAKNYAMTYVAGELTVKPRELIVKANNATRLYGEENPIFTLTYTGFVNNETKDVLNAEPKVGTSATIKSNAGTYDIVVNGGKALNYIFSYKSGQLTISPRNLNAAVGNYERVYGEDNPVFDVIYEGFVNNDTEISLNIKPSAKTSATKTSDVGTYDITLSGGYSPNYTFTYCHGMLTIVKAEQTIVWEQDLTNVEVGSQIELLAKASSGLPITYTMDSDKYAEIYKAGSKMFMECKKAGTFHIKAVQEGNGNYYSTQRINKKITIVDEDSAVEDISESSVTIKATSNGIKVTGASSGDAIRIYNIFGVLLQYVRAEGSQVDIPLHKDKVYVIKVSTKVIKLSL